MSIELSELEFSNIGEWPALAKGLLILVLCGGLIGAGFYFHIQEQFKTLDRHRATETQLRSEFETKQAKVVNLEVYKEQLEEMKLAFGAMLRQLPDKSEVADLLVDVSQTGLAAGLEFELFQPAGEVPKDFYVELPINIRVLGNYHEFGEFVSGLAALPRILTIHNVRIERRKDARNLVMHAVAKTYRYVGDNVAGGNP